MRLRILMLVLGLGLLSAGPVAAQAWDAPSFLPPATENSLGVYVIDPDPGDVGVVGIWRQAGRVNLGVRAGIFSVDDISLVVGAEASQIFQRANRALPVDVGWTLGVGGTIGNGSFVRIPVGVNAGRQFTAGTLAFLPYLHPRLGFDWFTNNGLTDLNINLTTDIGADISVGERLMVRFGAALGEWDAIGIGVALRTAPPVAVAAH